MLGVPTAAIIPIANPEIFINHIAKAGTINLNGSPISVNVTNENQVETSPGFFKRPNQSAYVLGSSEIEDARANPGKYFVKVKNVATIDGRSVDLKLSLVDIASITDERILAHPGFDITNRAHSFTYNLGFVKETPEERFRDVMDVMKGERRYKRMVDFVAIYIGEEPHSSLGKSDNNIDIYTTRYNLKFNADFTFSDTGESITSTNNKGGYTFSGSNSYNIDGGNPELTDNPRRKTELLNYLESIKNESVNDYVTMDSHNISFFSFNSYSWWQSLDLKGTKLNYGTDGKNEEKPDLSSTDSELIKPKKYNLTVKHIDIDNGSVINSDKAEEKTAGEQYTVTPDNLHKYDYVESSDSLTGTINE